MFERSKKRNLQLCLALWLMGTIYRCEAACNTLLKSSNGTMSVTVVPNQGACFWTISPQSPSGKSAMSVTLNINQLFLLTAEVHVYQGTSISGTQLYSCITCSDLPPLIQAQSSSIFIQLITITSISSTSSTLAQGFSFQWFGAYQNLEHSGKMKLILRASAGDIPSPSVSQQLPPNLDFQWLIQPYNDGSLNFPLPGPIYLMFENMYLPDPLDRLIVYNGASLTAPVLAVYTGSVTPSKWLVTGASFNSLLLRLVTNQNNQNGAFLARYWTDGDEWPTTSCGSLTQETFSGPTMLFTDGSKSTELETKGALCSWQISVTSPVWLVFYRVSIKGSLVVYAGTSKSGQVLFNCNGCLSLYPPPIQAPSGQLFISYFSNTATATVPTTGFDARYYSVNAGSYGMGDGELTLKAAAASLSLPGVDATVPRNLNYTWFISPDSSGQSGIILSINTIFMQDCGNKITVYDGQSSQVQLATLCATKTPTRWITSSGNTLRLEMRSVAQILAPVKFIANYYTNGIQYMCGISSNPMVLTSNTMVFSDGGAVQGNNCQWLIDPSQMFEQFDRTRPLVILFTTMAMPAKAVLKIYDGNSANGNLLMNCMGCTQVPPYLFPASGKAFVSYNGSNLSNQNIGFELRYYANYAGGQGIGNGAEYLVMPEAVIYPPSSNGYYPSNLIYSWTIQPPASTQPTIIVITQLDLAVNCGDTLVILDWSSHTMLKNFSGPALPLYWIQASGPSFQAQFTTNNQANQGGFEMFYYTDGPRYQCGYSTMGPHVMKPFSFRFSDGSGSGQAITANSNCSWLISPQVGSTVQNIVLVVERMSMKGAYFYVYDGKSPSALLLWSCTYDCRGPPGPISSSGPFLYISYRTLSKGVSGQGFVAQYYSNFQGSTGMGNFQETITAGTGTIFPPRYQGSYPYLQPYTWLIAPAGATGSITVFVELFNISDCANDQLYIYDGSSPSSGMLTVMCNNPSDTWIKSTSPAILVRFSSNYFQNAGDFRLHWFSNGPTASCGIISQPAVLKFASYWMSDGSLPSDVMVAPTSCAWLISPIIPGSSDFEIVLVFSRVDLQGGMITVYDGPSEDSAVLWECNGCSVRPPSLISTSKTIYVSFQSFQGSFKYGTGFEVQYFTSYRTNGMLTASPDTYLLDQPIPTDKQAKWLLQPTPQSKLHQISVGPVASYLNSTGGTCAGNILRGHAVLVDAPPSYGTWSCGILSSDTGSASLIGSAVNYSYALSPSGKFRDYRPDKSGAGYWCTTIQSSAFASLPSESSSYPACSYVIIPLQSASSVTVALTSITVHGMSQITVLEGTTMLAQILWSCKGSSCPSSKSVSSTCGKVLVVINSSVTDPQPPSLKLDYTFSVGTPLTLCTDEKGYAPYVKPPTFNYKILWIVLGVSFGVLIIGAAVYASKVKSGKSSGKVVDYEQLHLPHIDKPQLMDFYPRKLLTHLLHHGECLICYEPNARVFELEGCKHHICVDDMTAYLNAALGDASMFPLKCPMHHIGCHTIINPLFARKVLPKPQYLRFSVFHERACLGEGMDCIFCKKFVHLPALAEMKTPMVSCMHCHKHFCMKCKIPWHIGQTCEDKDGQDDIENWAEAIGASKCPSCQKFIEKSDAETCNHMVHKSTDAIPCVRERTDYCYLCGTEVAPGYPHIEIDKPTINHFPDGVFQECRKVMEKKKKKPKARQRRDSEDSWGSF